MQISSYFPGRIRLRAHVLKQDEEISLAFVKAFESCDFVNKVEYNPNTGSILLLYDHKLLNMEKLKLLEVELKELKTLCEEYCLENKSKILDKISRLVRDL